MHICPARDSTQEETGRHNSVAGIGKGLFNGDGGQVEEVGEHVEAEKHGRRICRDEVVYQVDERMVVMRRKRKRGLKRMIPSLMVLGCEVVSRMEDVAVDNIYQYL